MATAKSLEDLKKHLECAVCLDHFQDPKVLPCLHTYCKKCLEKVQKQSNGRSVITCPECRNETEVPNGKLESLPVNFFVNNIMSVMALQEESQKSSMECEKCDREDPPTARCSVCSMFLCNFCAEDHRRGKRTKDHKLMSMEEVKTSSPVTLARLHMCEEHEEETLKLYCQTCEKAICRDCTMVKHRNHKYDFVKEAYSREKETILEMLKKTKSKRDVLKEAIGKVSTATESVQEAAKVVEWDIHVWINQMIASLERQRTELHNSLKEKTASKVKELQIQQKELEIAFSCIDSSIDFTERAFQDGSQVEVLDMKKQISDRLSNLSTSIWKMDPCTRSSLYFIPKRSLLNQVEKVGCVVDCLAVAARSTVRLGMAEEGVMYNLVCGQTRVFHIQTRNEDGDCCSTPIENIEIEIAERQNNVSKRLEVTEPDPKKIGSFRFSYKPEVSGTYSMSVKVGGEDVRGSPFTWQANSWKLKTENQRLPLWLADNFNSRYVVDNAVIHSGCYSWKIVGAGDVAVGVKHLNNDNNLFVNQHESPKVYGETVYQKAMPLMRRSQSRSTRYRKCRQQDDLIVKVDNNREWLWYNPNVLVNTRNHFNIYLNLNKERLLIENICTSEVYEVDISGVACPVSPLFQLNSQESSVFFVES